MDWIIYCVQIIICIFEMYILYDFYSAFFNVRKIFEKKPIKIGTILLFAVTVYGVNFVESTVINLCFVPLSCILLCIVLFSGDIYAEIICSVVAILVLIGTEFIFVVIFSLTSSDLLEQSMVHEASAMLMTIIMKLITFAILLIIKQLSGKSTVKVEKSIFFLYMIIPIASLGLMLSVMYSGISFEVMTIPKTLLVIFYLALLIGNVVIVFGINRYHRLSEASKLQEKILVKQEIELKSYKQLEEADNKYARLMHDFNHYVRVISDLVNNQKNKELNMLLKNMQEEFAKIDTIEYSKNSIINAVLSDYKNKADKNGISYDVYIEPYFDIDYVDEMDMVAMLGNLLDNAATAAMKSEEKMISVRMFTRNEGSFSVIKVQNSFNGEIIHNNGRLFTTKTEEGNHGIGIKSIRDMADKYNGNLRNSWEDNVFTSVLILQKSLKKTE